MPLVKFLGGSTREDNTEIITLSQAADGQPRQIIRGGEAVEISWEELQQIASLGSIEVVNEDPAPVAEPEASVPDPAASPPSPPPVWSQTNVPVPGTEGSEA